MSIKLTVFRKQHISHPSIVSYIHSFTTGYFHCLVLEHIGGGELFSLVNSNEQYAKVTEPAIRRMWGELCRAVGWMHGVGLIHRDIKLESGCQICISGSSSECNFTDILLTSNIFATSNAVATLPPLNVPLIKLTDSGFPASSTHPLRYFPHAVGLSRTRPLNSCWVRVGAIGATVPTAQRRRRKGIMTDGRPTRGRAV